MVRTAETVGAPARPEPGARSRLAAAVGVVVVGAAAMSTAVFQTVVASSTSLPMHEPPGVAAPPSADPVLAVPAGDPGGAGR